MHLKDSIAASSNVEAQKPYIRPDYFPFLLNKETYITFQPFSKYKSKNYPYWDDVLKMIGNQLNNMGIKIVQLGGDKELAFEGTYNCIGKTTINQAAYIIKNGIAHIGVDSFMAHIAGASGKPVVALYGNNYIENVKPYWADKFIGLHGYGDDKPCFSEVDPHKSIHNIKPDDVAKAICDILNIKFEFAFETFWMGSECEYNRFDAVPNQVLRPETFKTRGFIIRMDYLHNEDIMLQQLAQCPCSIVTSKPINANLTPYKKNILELIYNVKSKEDTEYVKYLHKAGINYALTTYLPEQKLKKIKLDFLDFYPIIKINKVKPDFLKTEDLDDLFYESKRFILSDQRIYLNNAAWQLNKPVPNINSIQQFNKDYINEDLYESINMMRFYRQRKEN